MPPSQEQEAINLVRELRKIELSNFRVVGGIVRYDESARNILKDTKQRIVTSLTSQARGRDNYLIWAPPGSGKSFFIQEIAKSLGDKIEYTELNLAQADEPRFRSELSKVEKSNRPRLCFIDEVDSKPSESWPYEDLLPSLEPPDRNTIRTLFILAGSGGNSLSEMKEKMTKRPKGVDLLSRIPTRNESEIPGLALGDKLLVASTQFPRASSEKGRQTDEVEKLVLYYIALNPKLKSARQIRDLAIHCIERMPSGEERVKFDYLFDAGDPENKEFWISTGPLRNELVNTFVRLEDDQVEVKTSVPTQDTSRVDENYMRQETVYAKDRIAVLPFANTSPDPNDAYFADGITEELISTMSKIGELSVIARTSVMGYKSTQMKISEIARELEVGTILEGSVRKAGSRIRITAQLIDPRRGDHLWTESYDRDLLDVFAIQSEISQMVASALRVRLLPQEKERIRKVPTTDLGAYTKYMQGLFYQNKVTKQGLTDSLRFFEEAVARDPEFAIGYSEISHSYWLLGWFGFLPSSDVFPKVRIFAQRALSMDGLLAEAHLFLANFLSDYEWNSGPAHSEYKQAIELNPSLAIAHILMAHLLTDTGRSEEAVEEARKAADLDPLSASNLTWAGSYLLFAKRYDEAIELLSKALAIDANSTLARDNLGLAYVCKGNYERGVSEIESSLSMSGPKDAGKKADLAYAYVQAGMIDKAQRVLSEFLELRRRNQCPATLIACAYSSLGEIDQAYDWLEKAVKERDAYVRTLRAEFAFENIRSDPRFVPLLKRVGLLSPEEMMEEKRKESYNNAQVTPDKWRIAVLPFANISPDPTDGFFTDGMTEELISTLSKISDLKVISRTSVMRYKQTEKSLSEIANDLNVNAVLEGSVRKMGDDLRITAQLIDVQNDEHLWSEDYDRKFENVFTLQKEIAQKVADSLQVTILPKESKELGKRPTQNMEAYTLYLKGRSYGHRWTLDSFKRTIDYCEQAIQKDPNYAQAYAEIAKCYSYIGGMELLPSGEVFRKAERFAEKAVQLDPSVSESHLALGRVLFFHRWDFRGAEFEKRRALELSPNLVDGHLDLAEHLAWMRRFDEAVLECHRALELDPLSAWTCNWAANVFGYSRRIDECMDLSRNAIELDPNSAWAHALLGFAYVEKGKFDEGISETKLAIEMSGGIDVVQKKDLVYAYGRAGRLDEVRNVLTNLLSMRERGYKVEPAIALAYLFLGERDKAIEWLERAYEQRSGYVIGLNGDPVFDDFRSDPRFQALLRKIGFPDSG